MHQTADPTLRLELLDLIITQRREIRQTQAALAANASEARELRATLRAQEKKLASLQDEEDERPLFNQPVRVDRPSELDVSQGDPQHFGVNGFTKTDKPRTVPPSPGKYRPEELGITQTSEELESVYSGDTATRRKRKPAEPIGVIEKDLERMLKAESEADAAEAKAGLDETQASTEKVELRVYNVRESRRLKKGEKAEPLGQVHARNMSEAERIAVAMFGGGERKLTVYSEGTIDGQQTVMVAPADLYEITSDETGVWKRCHTCKGDYDLWTPFIGGHFTTCHRTRLEGLALNQPCHAQNWEKAPIHELGILAHVRRQLELRHVDTAGKVDVWLHHHRLSELPGVDEDDTDDTLRQFADFKAKAVDVEDEFPVAPLRTEEARHYDPANDSNGAGDTLDGGQPAPEPLVDDWQSVGVADLELPAVLVDRLILDGIETAGELREAIENQTLEPAFVGLSTATIREWTRDCRNAIAGVQQPAEPSAAEAPHWTGAPGLKADGKPSTYTILHGPVSGPYEKVAQVVAQTIDHAFGLTKERVGWQLHNYTDGLVIQCKSGPLYRATDEGDWRAHVVPEPFPGQKPVVSGVNDTLIVLGTGTPRLYEVRWKDLEHDDFLTTVKAMTKPMAVKLAEHWLERYRPKLPKWKLVVQPTNETKAAKKTARRAKSKRQLARRLGRPTADERAAQLALESTPPDRS